MWDNLFGNGWRPRRVMAWLDPFTGSQEPVAWRRGGTRFCASGWRVKASMNWNRQTLSPSLPRSLSSFNAMSAYLKMVIHTRPFNKACYFNLYSLETCNVPQIIHIPPSVLTNAIPSGAAWEQGVNMHFYVGVILSAPPTLSLLSHVIGLFKHLHPFTLFTPPANLTLDIYCVLQGIYGW